MSARPITELAEQKEQLVREMNLPRGNALAVEARAWRALAMQLEGVASVPLTQADARPGALITSAEARRLLELPCEPGVSPAERLAEITGLAGLHPELPEDEIEVEPGRAQPFSWLRPSLEVEADRAAVRALVEALPVCIRRPEGAPVNTVCGAPATKVYIEEPPCECDAHARPGVVDCGYALELRALLERMKDWP